MANLFGSAHPPMTARAASSTTLVQAHEVGRSYGHGTTQVTALAEASCVVQPGDRIALLGPSGSGKSTLLHLLAGLDTPTRGWIASPALGERATLRPARIGMVFQAPSLMPALTAMENVALPLLLQDMAPATARARAQTILIALNLAPLADQLPEALSGGQAQRVAVARALAPRPQLLIADEPTGQLDGSTAQQLLDVVLHALDGTDTALVIATHDPGVARRMTTIWQMQHGHLEGAPAC